MCVVVTFKLYMVYICVYEYTPLMVCSKSHFNMFSHIYNIIFKHVTTVGHPIDSDPNHRANNSLNQERVVVVTKVGQKLLSTLMISKIVTCSWANKLQRPQAVR
jgi:hypothetical protein